jgi:hypothetical protein
MGNTYRQTQIENLKNRDIKATIITFYKANRTHILRNGYNSKTFMSYWLHDDRVVEISKTFWEDEHLAYNQLDFYIDINGEVHAATEREATLQRLLVEVLGKLDFEESYLETLKLRDGKTKPAKKQRKQIEKNVLQLKDRVEMIKHHILHNI